MYISKFFRIDTTTIPGKYLSVLEMSKGEGYGMNMAEVSNTIHSDTDAIDGILLTCNDGDVMELEGLHKIIRDVRPPHKDVIVSTCGRFPENLDDLVGAGYINHVIFKFDSLPDEAQRRSLKIARSGDCTFCVHLVMDKGRFDQKTILDNKELFRDAVNIVLKRTKTQGDVKAYTKNEMSSLAKSLKGVAKEVRLD